MMVSTITELVETLEKRYPNDLFVMKDSDNEDKYIAKVELIKEIKKLGGLSGKDNEAK